MFCDFLQMILQALFRLYSYRYISMSKVLCWLGVVVSQNGGGAFLVL